MTTVRVPKFGGPRIGRPPKSALEKAAKPGQVGRPAGEAARMAEFKARLMATSGDKILDKIISVALDDNHPSQGAMLKFCGERLLPHGSFGTVEQTNKGMSINFHINGEVKSMEKPLEDVSKLVTLDVEDGAEITDVLDDDES